MASFIQRLTSSGSPETRSLNLEPYREFFGLPSVTGHRSFSGESAMRLTAVWACVNRLSSTVGSLPLEVYTTAGDLATDHPLSRLLGREANSYTPAGLLFETAMVDLNLYGNAYFWKDRDTTGRVTGLKRVDPRSIGVSLTTTGEKVFKYTGTVTSETYSQRDIVHIMGLSLNGIEGLSPISQARETLGLYSAHGEYQANFYRNNAQPGGVITMGAGKVMDEEGVKQMRAAWDSRHSGTGNAGNLAILTDGKEYQPLSVAMADQQFIDQLHYSTSQICNLFSVPQWLLGEAAGDSLTYSTIAEANKYYAMHSIRPWLVRIERSLLRDGDLFTDESLLPKFNMDELLRSDLAEQASVNKTRTEANVMAVGAGILTVDEARALDNREPLPANTTPVAEPSGE